MAATVTVPTVFTAIDRMSAVIKRISNSVGTFASKAESSIARGNRMFRKFTPALGEAGNKLLEYAKAAAIAGGIIATISFSVTSIKDYETAVASFRTIVSDLSDKDFAKFRTGIGDVAKDTKTSSIEVAKSFEKIAGLNATFAETSDGISAVSKAAIILSKASRDELGTSAENLVGIMNQFNLKASEADRTINVLAAGQAVGAASISQTSEAFKNFGSVASSSNISLEQSVGLIQTLGKFSIFGAEAGTKLRGATLKLQQAGAGYQSGQFKINDALSQVSKKYDKLKTQREKDSLLLKVFGAENISVGKILLNNRDTLEMYTKGVTGTSEAQKAAAINSDTLTVKLEELKSKWVNIITTSDSATSSLGKAKGVIGFVTDNMETLLSVGTGVLIFFGAWKAMLIAAQVAMVAYNIVLGIQGGLSGIASVAIGGNAIALGAYAAASWVATTAASAFAFAVNLGIWPITLIVAAIAAVIAIFMNWDSVVKWFSGVWGKFTSWISEAWNGIVAAFTAFSFTDMFMNIGKSIVDFFLLPLTAVLSLASKIPGAIGQGAASALKSIDDITAGIFVNDGTKDKPALQSPQMKSQEATREMVTTNKSSVDFNFNDPYGMVKSTAVKSDNANPMKIGRTQGAR